MQRIILFFLAAGLFAGCNPKPQQDKQTLYVSILPLRSLVGDIVGDDFRVEVLVPAGASPETFEPTARQFVELNNAACIFSVGLLDFETTLLAKIADSHKVINLSEGMEPIAGTCSHSEHGHRHAHGIDPHIWTSPRGLLTMAANAYKTIHTLYPDSAKYTANYEQLAAQLDALDKSCQAQIAESGVSYFIIYHPALTYYARDYGLRQVAIEADGKEPSARRIGEIIRQAREDGVKRILYQSQFPASTVEVIANDIGAKAIEIDPLSEDIINKISEITKIITAQ